VATTATSQSPPSFDVPGRSAGPTPVPVAVSGALPPGGTAVVIADARTPSPANQQVFTSLPATTNAYPPFQNFEARTTVSVYVCLSFQGGTVNDPANKCILNPALLGVIWRRE